MTRSCNHCDGLSRSRLLHRALADLSVAALAADATGRYIAVNQLAADMLGYDVQALETLSVWDLLPDGSARSGRPSSKPMR